jgi:hypothetical protein
MTTATQWSVSDIADAVCLGYLELENENIFYVMATDTRLVFGTPCNIGLLESGFITREDGERTDETLQELHADLETYYRDGANYVSRIVCNERM